MKILKTLAVAGAVIASLVIMWLAAPGWFESRMEYNERQVKEIIWAIRNAQRAYHKLVRTHDAKEQMAKEAFGKEPKWSVNYVQQGTYQECGHCKHFNGMNGCRRVQGFVAPTGWCVLWTHYSK